MNYYQPREMIDKETGQPSGLFRYTVQNDDRVWAVGYCADGCPGHATPDEAREHYRQYVLDHHTRYDGQYAGAQYQCLVCNAWTSRFASADHQPFCLCDEHCNRQEVEKLYKAGDAISSY